jgi:hypothetical protein
MPGKTKTIKGTKNAKASTGGKGKTTGGKKK